MFYNVIDEYFVVWVVLKDVFCKFVNFVICFIVEFSGIVGCVIFVGSLLNWVDGYQYCFDYELILGVGGIVIGLIIVVFFSVLDDIMGGGIVGNVDVGMLLILDVVIDGVQLGVIVMVKIFGGVDIELEDVFCFCMLLVY